MTLITNCCIMLVFESIVTDWATVRMSKHYNDSDPAHFLCIRRAFAQRKASTFGTFAYMIATMGTLGNFNMSNKLCMVDSSYEDAALLSRCGQLVSDCLGGGCALDGAVNASAAAGVP